MNILITSWDPQPQFIGGDKRVSLTLANIWKKQGHQVRIICFCPSPIKKEVVEGIEQLFLPDESVIDSPQNIRFLRQTVADQKSDVLLHQHALIDDFNRLCHAVKDLVKIVSVLHFDVRYDAEILANSFFNRYKIERNPKLYILDTLRFGKYILSGKSQQERRIGNRYRYLYEMSDIVSLLSDSMIGPFKKYIGIPDADRLTAINNPVVTAIPDSETLPEKEKTVVWCGRLEYGAKRTDRMLQIWKRINRIHPEWQLKILGSGDWDYYKGLIAKHGIKNAEVVGFCNPPEYYTQAAILCMTSTTEGFPMVLVEAQSYGCVPIAYNSFSSLHDIISDGENGFSVKAFDEDEYVKKLSLLMSDTERRNRMSANGIQSIHRFDADAIAGKWIGLFDNLLKQ